MSLEKYEASEEWRTNLKKFLFIERKPALKKTDNKADVSTSRYSLDVGKELQDIVNLHKNRKQTYMENKNCAISQNSLFSKEVKFSMSKSIHTSDRTSSANAEESLDNISDESFETLEKMCEKTASDPNSTLFNYLQKNSSKDARKNSPVRKINDTFEALEKMCDKTASDPDSTLFKYLNSDHKDEVLAIAKKRSADIGEKSYNNNAVNEIRTKFADCTMLDDVEAPSRLWENSITADAGFQTSPVKMIGLMRPSTILEEPVDESGTSDVSSQNSFQTASTKAPASDISSTYDTARESTVTNELSNQLPKGVEINVDDILMQAIEKSKNASLLPQIQTNHFELDENRFVDLENTLRRQESLVKVAIPDVVVKNDDKRENDVTTINDSSEDISVIDILSEDEQETPIKSNSAMLENGDKDYISVLNCNELNYENKENFSLDSLSEQSMKFNDTMEEVEYLLKKGIEYMTASDDAEGRNVQSKYPQLTLVESLKVRQGSQTANFRQNDSLDNSEAAAFVKIPQENIQQQTPNRFAFDMRPFPKLDIFGKPQQPAVTNPRQKELSSKQTFAHIVSPIGTYMKKTASTPLMSTSKVKNKNSNLLNSTAFRELEYESRLCQPKMVSIAHNKQCNGLPSLPGCLGIQKTLPKKAYISSELKHIVDERTPFTIPGGKKIQKYLENAMMPAVLRHDGKIKIPSGKSTICPTMAEPSSKEPNLTSQPRNTSQRKNASLADLSVMSGDVSMYTIMDAQKF
ncbi:uncharacterized protein LOC106093910 isoform X2 [Stomoxys calcitrans]|uniref:Uncharacterized protein n=1 Tax=Stomoxys calcitrans TaxID=35570 RepID=A0A1I8PK35_STOCA|nr:uncharacterized protein LOC106093910 isoform X2 [Stomoxys calcitrans]